MSDLIIRDIAGTSTRWDNPEKTDGELRQHLLEIGFRVGLLRTPKDDTVNKAELRKEAADLLLILARVFRREVGEDAQKVLDERYDKFCSRGRPSSPQPETEATCHHGKTGPCDECNEEYERARASVNYPIP